MDWQHLDLSPPYPTPASLTVQLTSTVLSVEQLKQLVQHSISRACLFADLSLLNFLLESDVSKNYVDLNFKDEDGLCIISQSIIGFGEQNDCCVDREECIRALMSCGASIDTADNCKCLAFDVRCNGAPFDAYSASGMAPSALSSPLHPSTFYPISHPQ